MAAATARYDARPGGAVAPTPPWVDDATTPHFNRAPDATKLFCNIHDKVQVAKLKFRENCWLGFLNQVSKRKTLHLWVTLWIIVSKYIMQETTELLRFGPSNFTCLSNLDEASGSLKTLNVPWVPHSSFMSIQIISSTDAQRSIGQTIAKHYFPNVH